MNLTAHFTENSEMSAILDDDGGPFYFAWSDADTAFDENIHARNDDDVFEFQIDQSEGDFATLRIQIKNPRIGLLAPGRKRWAWFSWRDPATSIVHPLFFGRLIGLPDELQDEVVELNLIARPDDFQEQKDAIAAGVRASGVWDPIWFSAADGLDADKILEGMPALFDTDRLALTVALTDITNGEEGTLDFTEDDIFYDSVHQHLAQNAIRKVTMTGVVSWDQSATGTVDLTHFNMSGNNRQGEHPGSISSWYGQGLTDAWPSSGGGVGGGWSWETAKINIISGPIASQTIGDYTSTNGGLTFFYYDGGFDTGLGAVGNPQAPGLPAIGWSYHVAIPLWRFTYEMVLGYDASRRKTETISFTLEADIQSIQTEPDDQEVLAINLQSSEAISLGVIDARDRTFFTTARGRQSIEYLIEVARAHLVARARAVEVEFDISFTQAVEVGLNCRKNASIPDERLSGGFAAGKIKRYTLEMQGGKLNASLTIGCMVGRDGTAVAVAGEPDWFDQDYIEDDYQVFIGEYVLPPSGSVSYQSIEGALVDDDGINFHSMTTSSVVKQWRLVNNRNENDTDQQGALSGFNVVVDQNTGQITTAQTDPIPQVILEVVDLTGGPFEQTFPITVTDLKIPRTIDLESGPYA
jgi:hypothetical protein